MANTVGSNTFYDVFDLIYISKKYTKHAQSKNTVTWRVHGLGSKLDPSLFDQCFQGVLASQGYNPPLILSRACSPPGNHTYACFFIRFYRHP